MKIALFILTAFVSTCYSQTTSKLSASDYYKSAGSYVNSKLYEKAILDFTKAIELKPDYADAYAERGLYKTELNDNKGAILDFTKAIELKPNNPYTYSFRGRCKLRLKDYKGALPDYTKAIDLKPNYALAYYARGLIKQLLGEKDSGCLDFLKAGELGDEDAYQAIKKYCN
jgi:tetratricopeptide (TPR) repeat protein